MAKQVITSDQLYPVYGPYSHAVRVGDMIFLHGTVGFDPQGRLPGDTPGRADMVRQCEQTIANMATALQLLGGSLQDVVKVRAFLPQHCRPARAGQQSFANMAITLQEAGGSLADLVQTQVILTDWHAYMWHNEVYNRHVPAPFPTNSTFQGGLGREGLLIEIESIAALATPRLTIDSAFTQAGQARQEHQPDVIYSDKLAPQAAQPHGVRVGDLMFIGGHTTIDTQGHLVGPGDIRAQ